jgi:hypothetical protein
MPNRSGAPTTCRVCAQRETDNRLDVSATFVHAHSTTSLQRTCQSAQRKKLRTCDQPRERTTWSEGTHQSHHIIACFQPCIPTELLSPTAPRAGGEQLTVHRQPRRAHRGVRPCTRRSACDHRANGRPWHVQMVAVVGSSDVVRCCPRAKRGRRRDEITPTRREKRVGDHASRKSAFATSSSGFVCEGWGSEQWQ